MAIIIYGTKKAVIGVDETMTYCPSCETDSFADIMVSSIYCHIYFVPVFPISKEVIIVCQQCGLKRYDLPFNARTLSNYIEIKSNFKHPWYTYSILGLIGIIIVSLILS